MKVRVTVEERKDVELDRTTMLNVTDKTIRVIYDLPDQCLINDKGDLCEWWEEGGGSHSWFEEKKIRKATNQDKMIMKVLQKIHDAHHEDGLWHEGRNR